MGMTLRRVTFQQPDAQQVFQFLDGGAEGGLADKAGCRRLAEMAPFDDGHEEAHWRKVGRFLMGRM